jgi:delta 1-pyrroline-5-carboxylate dehydrogenase
MLFGAMDELRSAIPGAGTDIGPVIDAEAQADIAAYVDEAGEGRLLQGPAPREGTFVGPALIRWRHRRPGARGVRPGPACGHLPAEDIDP